MKIYRETPDLRLTARWIPAEAYAQALGGMIITCTDVLIVNRSRKICYLARRKSKPMQHWWFIGGRRLMGETPAEGMARCFTRETALHVPAERFEFEYCLEYMFKDRQQLPQSEGCHSLVHLFSIELTQDEIEAASENLNEEEYEAGGLVEFNREQLLRAEVFPSIVDAHAEILF